MTPEVLDYKIAQLKERVAYYTHEVASVVKGMRSDHAPTRAACRRRWVDLRLITATLDAQAQHLLNTARGL
jgi:hypothetical protein